jgi:class 3 adenylate cyclase
MGLHTGTADERDGDYFGPTLNRAARLMSTAHGGQVVMTSVTAASLGHTHSLVDLGEHRLKDLGTPARVFQLGDDGEEQSFPPLRYSRTPSSGAPTTLRGSSVDSTSAGS